YSLAVMASVLHRWCSGCVTVHVINGLLFGLALLAFPRSRATPVDAPHPSHRLAAASLLAGLLALVIPPLVMLVVALNSVAGQVWHLYRELISDPAFTRWDYERQPQVEISDAEPESCEGVPGAPNTVVAFIDFECPRCKEAHSLLGDLLSAFPGKLRVQY